MKVSNFARMVLVAAAGILGVSGAAKANSIGLDFSAGGSTPVTTLAGVVPQTNWNNLTTNGGSLAAGTVLDSTGATPAGLAASWGANGSSTLYQFGGTSFTGADANQTGDTNLYSDSLLTFGPGLHSGYQGDVMVTGISYATYDVYAYVEGGGGQINLNGTPSAGDFAGGTTVLITSAGGTNYVPVSGGVGNYYEFAGVTGSSLTLYDQQGSGGGLAGVEIVADAGSPVPEPASLGLLAVGAMACLARRRGR